MTNGDSSRRPGEVTPISTSQVLAPRRSPARPGDAELDAEALRRVGAEVVARALAEDLDDTGDLTVQATVDPALAGSARLVARRAGVVAGLWLVAEVYRVLEPRVRVRLDVDEGAEVVEGQVLALVDGPLGAILTGERTALNLVGHLSGVASATARVVAAVEGSGAVIRDTRKTTPGLRLLEKAAVRAGGGVNHRTGLFDALLVKDNHVVVAGSVAAATRAAFAAAAGRHVQVEVDSLDELDEALEAGARDVLLDNFDLATTRAAVARVRERERRTGDAVLIESSGRLQLDTVRAYADAGVDRLALGAITHSAPQLDVALDVVPELPAVSASGVVSDQEA